MVRNRNKKKISLFQVRKKKSQNVEYWLTYKITQNNAFMVATSSEGEPFIWRSAGRSGFKGPRRATPYAASVTGSKFFYKLVKKLKKTSREIKRKTRFYPAFNLGVLVKGGRRRKVKLMLKGFFAKMRKNFKLINSGKMPQFRFKCIIRKSRMAHNGLRKRKKRRV